MTTAPLPRSRRAGTIAAAVLIAVLIGSATSGPPWAAAGAAPAGETMQKPPAEDHAWNAPRVRELIGLIEEARAAGLEPENYGLAALRSELELAEELWGTDGSRQLDSLARSSALRLAADLRGIDRRGPAASLGRQLDLALASGKLGDWMREARVASRGGPTRKEAL